MEVFISFPFRLSKCQSTEPVKIVEYLKDSENSRPLAFFPKKTSNRQGCTLRMAAYESITPSVFIQHSKNGSYRLYGRDIIIIEAMAKEMIFKLEIFLHRNSSGPGAFFNNNGTASGPVGRVIFRQPDFIIGSNFLKYERAKFMSYSYVYISGRADFYVTIWKAFFIVSKINTSI